MHIDLHIPVCWRDCETYGSSALVQGGTISARQEGIGCTGRSKGYHGVSGKCGLLTVTQAYQTCKSLLSGCLLWSWESYLTPSALLPQWEESYQPFRAVLKFRRNTSQSKDPGTQLVLSNWWPLVVVTWRLGQCLDLGSPRWMAASSCRWPKWDWPLGWSLGQATGKDGNLEGGCRSQKQGLKLDSHQKAWGLAPRIQTKIRTTCPLGVKWMARAAGYWALGSISCL